MTVWERSLRPKQDSHWMLWLALAAAVVFLAYRGGEWLLERRTPLPAATTSSAPTAVATEPTPPSASVQPAAKPNPRTSESYGVTKCISALGTTAYSDGPCPEGSRPTIVWVQPDVNLSDGLSAADREASTRNNSAVLAQIHRQEQRIALSVENASNECTTLDAQIKSIDAMARQPQSAWTQDQLTRDRKDARGRQFRLQCRQ